MHEAFVADTACERFLVCVDTSVCYKRCTFYESFTTNFTTEALVCSVNAGMTNKIGPLCEQLLTHITLERPNSSKTCYTEFSAAYFRNKWHIWMKGECMMRKRVTVAKPFVAYLAAVRFITCVGAGVNHKAVAKRKLFVAHFTDKRSVSCMDAPMCY